MVFIVVKKSEQEQFLYETTCKESNDVLIRNLVKVNNMRLKTDLLAGAIEELGKYGPAKPEVDKGIDEIKDAAHESEGGTIPNRGTNYNADPSGNRTGEAPDPKLQELLSKVAKDSRQCLGADQVRLKLPCTIELLQEKLDTIRGAVTMAYPMGLPKYDPIRMAIEDTEHSQDIYGPGQLDPATAQLWWAGKEFFRDQTVGDRVGRNEKTKVIAKLLNPGSGAPAREPAVSEEERKAMMAHYFKKQEQMKRLAEDNEDQFMNSSWANSSALKQSLNGTGSIRFR
mmetsp:Transcript_21070/g.25625  ORF Transcript_21070/g.25625 Transcript_21070/m.25625 type:complete len:284 (+) Transcript_21070:167-1018(+)|eukprot:CAMPEP_0204827304 /NCGR_PEP_ID=MMETSP1346-20131115/4789_1 /ASSEMBLY_ACC=CAM_ASM_000771 /TAXON_ID=215587 /ORGANISM="Aplanochytrium stocchinoi, Strain GSBS06" /LENGTH=283 /DNA_ID=CAMNT_0051955661 /DNA_START=73 /DNA_END=924 /DNA_ORIENTATION=-